MKTKRCLSAAFLVMAFSVLSIYAADQPIPTGWSPTIGTPGLSVQYIRTVGDPTTDHRACVKLLGYNEFQIQDITTFPGQQIYATLLAALTSGAKVYVYISTNSPYFMTGVGLSVN